MKRLLLSTALGLASPLLFGADSASVTAKSVAPAGAQEDLPPQAPPTEAELAKSLAFSTTVVAISATSVTFLDGNVPTTLPIDAGTRLVGVPSANQIKPSSTIGIRLTGDKKRVLLLNAAAMVAKPQAPAPTRDLEGMRKEVEALAHLTAPPKYTDVERADATPSLKPILFSALDYQGKPTTVFAWLGVPEKCEGKVPGVVLVHGGGGSASKAWVQSWNNRGYAAISLSLEGQMDYDPALKGYAKNPNGGPARPGIFGDSAAPIKDQWMYHVVADATLASALLRSLPEVDPDKIGINGCSWGGIITAIVIGIDPRYAFAIPVYGCGGLDAVPNHYGSTLSGNEVYKKVWDANLRLNRARMPILWHSWPQDAHFSMEAVNRSRKITDHEASLLCLIPGMGHGNLSDRPEWFAFADSVVKDGKPWIREKSSKLENGKAQATFESSKPLESAAFVSTIGTGHTGTRTWVETPANLSQKEGLWMVDASVPEGTTACFLNVKSGPLTATSDYFETK